jgi:hypothetical protein
MSTQYVFRRTTTKVMSMMKNHRIQPKVSIVSNSSIIQQQRNHPFSSTSTSSQSDLVSTKLDLDHGIAEITMHNGSVNSLSLEM